MLTALATTVVTPRAHICLRKVRRLTPPASYLAHRESISVLFDCMLHLVSRFASVSGADRRLFKF
jgi:hypothetical protein